MKHKNDILLVIIFSILTVGLYLLPNKYDVKDDGTIRCTATIIEVDDSEVANYGLVRQGEQELVLKIDSGMFKDKIFDAHNQLMGQMDRDKLFRPGDSAYVILTLNEKGEVIFVNPQAHYRLGLELLLFGLFAGVLIIFGGFTGLKALLSFVFTGMLIWRVLIPLLLLDVEPIWLALCVVTTLCSVIIFLVAGLNRTGITAFLGAFLGVLTSCILAVYFTTEFHVHGAVMPFAETLLYAGYNHLNLTHIYMAGLFVASSGAVMDLAMDVAASMREVIKENPSISRKELVWCGIRVGRSVVGTMTTTLLLAYSGGYITLLMAFLAQGIPLGATFNFIYVAAEVLKTLIGSFGLVAVAPFTAFVGGLILKKRE